MKKIVLVTTQVAPFQVELAEAINSESNYRYHVLFTTKENRRPPHWLDINERISSTSTIVPDTTESIDQVIEWTVKQLDILKPDVVLIGGIRGIPYRAALAYRSKLARDVLLGLWLEPPFPNRNLLHRSARRAEYFLRIRRVDFVLAIGDRAHAYYRSCNSNTHFVPYGSDLSLCLNQPLPKPYLGRIKFLFSGGLHARHNFPLIMRGLRTLLATRGPTFEFIVSGDGPEQVQIDSAISEEPLLRELIRYDRNFKNWSDRLNPFLESHVFLYPTSHSGWGLVIPEAMAAGNLVITTRNAEAARYLISNGVNGLKIEPNDEMFVAALQRCVDEPKWVESLGLAARESARRCHGLSVAQLFSSVIRIATNGRV